MIDIPEPYKAQLVSAVFAAIGRGAMKPSESNIHLNVEVEGSHSIYSLMGRLAIYKACKRELARINALTGTAPKQRLADRSRELYDRYIDQIREVARVHGYAIGVHGSIARDIDLIAVPWSDDARPGTELVSAIIAVCAPDGAYLPTDDWVDHKPHGRMGYPIYFPSDEHQPYIDLSVVATSAGPQPDREIRKWWDATATERIFKTSNPKDFA